jgi:hypothetical protein
MKFRTKKNIDHIYPIFQHKITNTSFFSSL